MFLFVVILRKAFLQEEGGFNAQKKGIRAHVSVHIKRGI
jgi:hypothetical protein